MATKTVRRGWLALVVLGALASTALVGCGGAKRVPVSGTVTVDGQPVDGGILSFCPDAEKGNTASINCVSPVKGGRFELKTSAVTERDSGPGVPLGWYKVTYHTIDLSTKKKRRAPVEVNAQYRSAETTPLSIEVKDDPQPGAYDIKLTN